MKPASRWISADARCVVEITADALERMIEIADQSHPLEGGAALHGRYDNDRNAWIEGAAPQARDAQRGRFHFRRGQAGLATFFRKRFSDTVGESYYVGEFHSHPNGVAAPSDTDDNSQFAIATDPACQCSAPILVIVGGVPGHRHIGVFVYTHRRRKYVLVREGAAPS